MIARIHLVLGALAIAFGCLAWNSSARAEQGSLMRWLWPLGAATDDGADQLQLIAQRLPRMADAAAQSTIAGRVTADGQWTIVNMAGETFTAAGATELKRGLEILMPAPGSGRARVILTGDSYFDGVSFIAQLPPAIDLALGWGDGVFSVTKTTADKIPKYFATVKATLTVELSNHTAFEEAVAQLSQPLRRQDFRVLSIVAGGPHAFSHTPRIDTATGRADVDAIDPDFLIGALGPLSRQVAVIVGRIDGPSVSVRLATGAERSWQLSALGDAAAANDVDLLVLTATSAQQPGGRNWLGQRIDLKGLDVALGQSTVGPVTLGDLFSSLGSQMNGSSMTVTRALARRTTLTLQQADTSISVSSAASRIGSVISEALSSAIGNVAHEGAWADFRSVQRRSELDRRFVPYVPAALQWLYVGLFVLGIGGARLSWGWWTRLWPSERREDFPGKFGYWAARIVRVLVFCVLFMPIAAPAAASAGLTRALKWPRNRQVVAKS